MGILILPGFLRKFGIDGCRFFTGRMPFLMPDQQR